MTINTISIPAGQALNTLKALWDAQKNDGVLASTMMWGKPGIGKTQVAEQLAEYVGGRLYDIRLTTIDAADLHGLPYYNHETKTTEWYRPSDLPGEGAPAILFLDELSSAPAHIQPTVYGLLQERRIGEHKIPDNVMIVAAGNEITDGAVAYEMGTAIADRLIHLKVHASPEDWTKNYAVPRGLHPAVIAFIRTSPQHFENSEEAMRNDKTIATTPRSWERVSKLMFSIKDPSIRRTVVGGTIGDSVAADFFIVADDIEATVQVDAMLAETREKRMKMVPNKMYGLNAMVFGLVGAATDKNIERIMEVFADLADTKKFIASRNSEDQAKFRNQPILELATYGMEQLMLKALKNNAMTQKFIASPIYAQYSEMRHEMGLQAQG